MGGYLGKVPSGGPTLPVQRAFTTIAARQKSQCRWAPQDPDHRQMHNGPMTFRKWRDKLEGDSESFRLDRPRYVVSYYVHVHCRSLSIVSNHVRKSQGYEGDSDSEDCYEDRRGAQAGSLLNVQSSERPESCRRLGSSLRVCRTYPRALATRPPSRLRVRISQDHRLKLDSE